MIENHFQVDYVEGEKFVFSLPEQLLEEEKKVVRLSFALHLDLLRAVKYRL